MPTLSCIISCKIFLHLVSAMHLIQFALKWFQSVSCRLVDLAGIDWPNEFGALRLGFSAGFPKTRRSESVFPPSRLAPLIPAAHSPAGTVPGTRDIWLVVSTRIPPITNASSGRPPSAPGMSMSASCLNWCTCSAASMYSSPSESLLLIQAISR